MSESSTGGMFSFLMKENIVAKPGFNRWYVPPASIANYMIKAVGEEHHVENTHGEAAPAE